MIRWMLVVAGLCGVSGVAVGAFAAHGLESWLTRQAIDAEAVAKRLAQCDVAVRYHLLHTLALLTVGLSQYHLQRLAKIATALWIIGICLFSGGLYSLVFLGASGHWAIVPSGGVCFILGWSTIVMLGIRLRSGDRPDRSAPS